MFKFTERSKKMNEIKLDEYEKIIIGIGNEFNMPIEEKNTLKWAGELQADENILKKNEKASVLMETYDHLATLMEGRDYFLISVCNDDLIYKSGIDKDRIVAPCGGFRYLQCPDDCKKMLLPFDKDYLSEGKWPVCPGCGKPVSFNRLPRAHYNEGGYMEEWEAYNKWLASTVNRRLLILELGVGMEYPTVIRFAFEKLAFFNKKSDMYRVHPSLAFCEEKIKDNCHCITADAVEFLRGLC